MEEEEAIKVTMCRYRVTVSYTVAPRYPGRPKSKESVRDNRLGFGVKKRIRAQGISSRITGNLVE